MSKRILMVALTTTILSTTPTLAETENEKTIENKMTNILESTNYKNIEKNGDEYTITIDLDKLFENFKFEGTEIKLGKFISKTKKDKNGKWIWSMDELNPMKVRVKERTSNLLFKNLHAAATFPSENEMFESVSAHADQIDLAETNEKTNTISTKTTKNINMNMTSSKSKEKGTDIIGNYSADETDQSIVFSDENGEQGEKIEMKIGGIKSSFNIDNLRDKEIFELMNKLSDDDTTEINMNDIKKIFPIFNKTTENVDFSNPSINSTFGTLNMDNIHMEAGLSGITENGAFNLLMKFDNMNFKSKFLPEWSEEVVPKNISFGFDMFVKNLRTITEKLLDGANEEKNEYEIFNDIENDMDTDIYLNKTKIDGKSWNIEANGHLKLTKYGLSGNLNINAHGIEKVIEKLKNEKNDENAQKILMGLTMAESLSQKKNENMEWNFTFDKKQIMMNGRKIK